MKRTSAKVGNRDAISLRDERLAIFYREGGPGFGPGNATQSAIAAGYAKSTALAKCHVFAARAGIRAADALRAEGSDEFFVARKLRTLAEAKLPKWNTKRSKWDMFEHPQVQLGAVQEMNKVLDAYPAPKEFTGDNRPIQIIFPANFKDAMVKESAGD